jgi:F0F1-type ATP synthase alpha subunit
VNEGHFDRVPREKIKDAQAALLAKLAKEHGKEMDALNTGDEKVEADSATNKLLTKITATTAKGFEN